MLVHEFRTTSLRLYLDQNAGYWATPDAQLAVMWLDPTTVIFSDFRGSMTRKLWVELRSWVITSNISTIHAERKSGHVLPCERPCFLGPNWRTIYVEDLKSRIRA